jgi:hypothetical protein
VVNRTQSLVLGFFAFVWISLAIILLVEPGIYDSAMKLPPVTTVSLTWLSSVRSRLSSSCSSSGC